MNYYKLALYDPDGFIKLVMAKPKGLKRMLNTRFGYGGGTFLHYVVENVILGNIEDSAGCRLLKAIKNCGGDLLIQNFEGKIPYQLFMLTKQPHMTHTCMVYYTTHEIIDGGTIKCC
jgi:hypothetical protein